MKKITRIDQLKHFRDRYYPGASVGEIEGLFNGYTLSRSGVNRAYLTEMKRRH